MTEATGEKKPTVAGGRVGFRGVLAAGQKQKKLLADSGQFGLLLRRVYRMAPVVLMGVCANFAMANQGGGDTPTLENSGLLQQQIHVSRGNVEWSMLNKAAAQQSGAQTINHDIPLLPPMEPKVATKAEHKADNGAQQANNAAVSINPVKKRTVYQWVSFWLLCAVWGYCVGAIIAPPLAQLRRQLLKSKPPPKVA